MFVHVFLVTYTLEFLVSADDNIGDTRLVKPDQQGNILSDYHGIVQVYSENTGMSTFYNLAMYRLHNK